MTPEPRQGLSKAADAELHPALPPTEVVTPLGAIAAATSPAAELAAPAKKHRDKEKSKSSKKNPLKVGRGKATSDTIRGTAKGKNVDLGVKVPKSLRKALRAEAVRRGIKVDDLVTILLNDRIQI